jgi:ATP-dependent Clp protease protease subunit
MAAPLPTIPPEVYGVFSDQINQATVQRIFQSVGIATNAGVLHAHILFQSSGGFVGDGVCLYNFFRTLPIELTLYNVGSVQSIATVAYLGAVHRKVSANAAFGIHRTTFSPQNAQASQLEAFASSARLDDFRTDAILRTHLNLSEAEWTALDHGDLVFGADDAVRIGLAESVGDFAPPMGTKLFNI